MSTIDRSIEFSHLIKASPAALFHAFIDATAWTEWCCDEAKCEPYTSKLLYVFCHPDYIVNGEFTQLEQNKKIEFTWQGTNEPLTQVRVALTPHDDGTTLYFLVIGKCSDQVWDQYAHIFESAWGRALANLKTKLESGELSKKSFDILIAGKEDANEILALQKIAYQGEAAIYNDYSIPPLHQTLQEILAEFNNHTVLKILSEGKIIGSVRGCVVGITCYIGKLIVDPSFQNQGIGTSLLREMERLHPDAERFELFTGEWSEKNLHLYNKLGYKIFKSKEITPRVRLVYMERHNS